MHEDNGAGFGPVHGTGGHHGGAGLAPVVRIHVPHDGGKPEALPRPGGHPRIRITAGGAHDHGDHATGVADGFIGPLKLVFRLLTGYLAQISMVPGVVPHFMAFIDHAAHHLGMGRHIAALHEESTFYVIVAQNIQHLGGQRSVGTVVKSEGNHLVRYGHAVHCGARNARSQGNIVVGRAHGRHGNGLFRQFHHRAVRLFSRSGDGGQRRSGGSGISGHQAILVLTGGTGGKTDNHGACKE